MGPISEGFAAEATYGEGIYVGYRHYCSVTGHEVVQLYVSAPNHELDKPERKLCAFTKTGSLQPGDSETVRFELGLRDIASWSVARGGWFAESGEYKVQAAASCVDVRLEAVFTR